MWAPEIGVGGRELDNHIRPTRQDIIEWLRDQAEVNPLMANVLGTIKFGTQEASAGLSERGSSQSPLITLQTLAARVCFRTLLSMCYPTMLLMMREGRGVEIR